MKRITYQFVADTLGVHIDTLFKARKAGRCSPKLASELNRLFGVSELKCLFPEKYGSPWAELTKMYRDPNSGVYIRSDGSEFSPPRPKSQNRLIC